MMPVEIPVSINYLGPGVLNFVSGRDGREEPKEC
jgi:hypothetical protein